MDDVHLVAAAAHFVNARRSLLPPHIGGEALAFARAFRDCWLGHHELDRARLDTRAAVCLLAVERALGNEGLGERATMDQWLHRAEQLTVEQMHGFARALDELALYLDRAAHGQAGRQR